MALSPLCSQSIDIETSQGLRNCPKAKKGFIASWPFLSELLSALSALCGLSALSSLSESINLVKFDPNCEIWSELSNLVKIVKSSQACEIWSKL